MSTRLIASTFLVICLTASFVASSQWTTTTGKRITSTAVEMVNHLNDYMDRQQLKKTNMVSKFDYSRQHAHGWIWDQINKKTISSQVNKAKYYYKTTNNSVGITRVGFKNAPPKIYSQIAIANSAVLSLVQEHYVLYEHIYFPNKKGAGNSTHLLTLGFGQNNGKGKYTYNIYGASTVGNIKSSFNPERLLKRDLNDQEASIKRSSFVTGLKYVSKWIKKWNAGEKYALKVNYFDKHLHLLPSNFWRRSQSKKTVFKGVTSGNIWKLLKGMGIPRGTVKSRAGFGVGTKEVVFSSQDAAKKYSVYYTKDFDYPGKYLVVIDYLFDA